MAQTKLELVVSFLGGAAVSGLTMLRQNVGKLKADLEGVKLKQQLGADLLALKGRFNEVTKSGQYTKDAAQAVTQQLADLSQRARDAGLNVGRLHQQLRQLKAQEMGLGMQIKGQGLREAGAAKRTEARGGIMEAAASGYALYKPLDLAARYEDVVKDIAITGDITRKEEAALAASIRGLSLRFNQEQQNVATAMKKLVETGMSRQTAEAMMPLMAKTATATRTDSADAARMGRSFELLGVKDMELAFNQAAKAGKQGSFELRDMAKWFPSLGGFMKELGIVGNEAVVSMSARMQVATRTAGSNDEAANNFKNFLTKLTSQDTVKDFKKQGVDLVPSLQAAARQGMDPIAAGVDLVMQHVTKKAPEAAAELRKVAAEVAAITDPAQRAAELERRQAMIKKLGDRAGIGDLFQDMQAVSYLLAELQSKGDLKKMMGSVVTGQNANGQGVIDADFARRTEGMAEKMRGLKIAMTELGIAFGNALMPVADALMPIARGAARMLTGFTETFPALARISALALTGASAMTILGLAGKFLLGGFLSSWGGLMTVAGWLLRTRVGLLANAWATGLYSQALGGLRARLAAVALASSLAGGPLALLGQVGRSMFAALAVGARAFGLALMTTPIGWVAAAVAGLAFVVWRYWAPIRAFAGGLWDGLKAGMGPVMAALQPGVAGLRLAFGNLMAALQPLMPVLQVLLVPLLAPVKAVLWGLGQLRDLVKALFTPVQDTGGAARGLGLAFGEGIGRALTWVATLAGSLLALPARFMQAGADMVGGLVAGIKSGWGAAIAAVTELGAGVRDKFKALLGIASPSRVFMGFGANIGEGAELGILRGLPGVQGAMGKLAGVALAATSLAVPAAVLPALSNLAGSSPFAAVPAANQSLRRLEGGAYVAPAGAAASGAGQMTVSFSPTIHVGGGGDARGQVAEAMQLSLRELEQMLRRLQSEQQRRDF